MNCMDLFVAAFAVSFAFLGAKEFFRLLMAWVDDFRENWKKPQYIFMGIFLFLSLFYFSFVALNCQLF